MANKKKKVTTTVTTTITEEIINVSTNEETQIICILDRSGSMAEGGIIYECINTFNKFLNDQKKLKDKATITVALFDDRYDLLYDNIDIQKVEDITYEIWTPRGLTALYDAIGKTINVVKSNHIKLGDKKPAKVLVCIVTDGYENASKEYNRENIKKLIKDCEEDNWNFIYLAANQDAFAVGTSFGISANNTYSYVADFAGVTDMSAKLNSATSFYRNMSVTSDDFKLKSKKLIDNKDDVDLNN